MQSKNENSIKPSVPNPSSNQNGESLGNLNEIDRIKLILNQKKTQNEEFT